MPQIIRRTGMRTRDPLNASAYVTNRPENPADFYQPIYDCGNFSATAGTTSEISFFSTVRGQSATLIRGVAAGTFTKTYRDTNMDQPNVISSKLAKIIGISLGWRHAGEITQTNPTDREMVRNGGYLEFRVIDKLVWVGPLILLPDINPFTSVSTVANGVTSQACAGGGGSGNVMMKLNIPVVIRPNENFTVKATFDPGAAAIDLAATLDVYVFLHAYVRQPG